MANIPVKLSAPVNSYTVFEDNQVLTASQLNSISGYFDYQQRLTRARLLGAGIVCGLNIFFDQNEITVSKGVAVTSDGDLIVLEKDMVLGTIGQLDDRKAKYKLFEPFSNAETGSSIWQLGVIDPNAASTSVLNFFRQNATADFVVLLYLSQFDEDTDLCSSNECDNKGIIRQNNLSVLLMRKAEYDKIASASDCCSDNYFKLPDISIQRVLLNENDSLFSYNDLQNAYKSVFANVNKGDLSLASALEKADAVAQSLFKCYSGNGKEPESRAGLNRRAISGLDAKSFSTGKKFLSKFNDLVGPAVINNVQYIYDFVKEVSEAYEEFKEASFELCHGCCIDPNSFPKHIALGIPGIAEAETDAPYRQCFLESPILNNKDEKLFDVLQLYSRLVILISNFKTLTTRDLVKITPCGNIHQPIGERAIPCYYDAKVLAAVWNPAKTRRRRFDTNLSYDANGDSANGYTKLTHVIDPLRYNTDKYEFYRIEGHVGKTYDAAFSQVQKLQQQFDLPFDLVGVQLQKERLTVKPTRFHFPNHLETLAESHKHSWNAKLDLLKQHNTDLLDKIPTVTDLNKEGVTGTYGSPIALRQQVLNDKATLDRHIDSVRLAMSIPLNVAAGAAENSTSQLAELHKTMSGVAANMSGNARLFTRSALATPLESITHYTHPKILDWLNDLKIKIDEKIADGYVFSSFLKQNPGMMHNGGVPRGGTFVLVYNTVNNVRTVVADFYLPYSCHELVETNVQPGSVGIRPTLPLDHLNIKDFVKKPLLNDELFGVIKNFGAFTNNYDLQVRDFKDQFTGVKSEINDKIGKTFETYNGSFKTLVGAYENVYIKNKVAGGLNLLDTVKGLMATSDEDLKGLRPEEQKEFKASISTITSRMKNLFGN